MRGMSETLRSKAYLIKQKIKKKLRSMRPHYRTVDEYWLQKIPYTNIGDRLDLFREECKAKDVLHFGCTDWPVFNPKNNLHITLSEITKSIDGFDIDKPGIEALRSYVGQEYYSDFESLSSKKYDVCLIPETIEHVDNVGSFLSNLSKVNASKFLITAPNCFSQARQQNYRVEKDTFIEIVHPDHNAWYSPYTLKNVIEKYSELEVTKVYLMQNKTMVCCEAIKKK
ncbi:MAG: hypothetical protein ACI828_002267 [Flavobacteriales bacterium]|jgi:hypothetical protein